MKIIHKLVGCPNMVNVQGTAQSRVCLLDQLQRLSFWIWNLRDSAACPVQQHEITVGILSGRILGWFSSTPISVIVLRMIQQHFPGMQLVASPFVYWYLSNIRFSKTTCKLWQIISVHGFPVNLFRLMSGKSCALLTLRRASVHWNRVMFNIAFRRFGQFWSHSDPRVNCVYLKTFF